MSSLVTRRAHLLHADEEQLDRAVIALRGGTGFVLALCPPELRPEAEARLRDRITGLTPSEQVVVSSEDEMLSALVEQVGQSHRLLSLVLERNVDAALDALNLHREKVLKGGPVILWLEHVASLQ